MVSGKRKIIILTILAGLSIGLLGQKPEFSASAPSSVQAGQQFQYSVQGNQKANVSLPDLKDFQLLAGPFSQFSTSTQWVNGKMTAQTTATYTYILSASAEGEFTIPPAVVRVNKETLKTNPVKVSVTTGSSATAPGSGNTVSSGNSSLQPSQPTGEKPVFLKINPSKRSVYLGEQLVSELKIYTSVNTRPAGGGLKEVPYEGFYKQTLDPDQVSSRENIDGKIHVTQVLQRHILIPQKSGELVIPAYSSEWTIPQRVQSQRSRSLFDDFFDDPFSDPFFDRIQNVPVEIFTDPVTINVKPLPPGAPKGFTGGVGQFKFSANLSEDDLEVNESTNLVVRISGTSNLALISAPDVNFPPDHDVYETTKKASINTNGNRVGGTITFEYPVVVRHAGNFRIPPLTFSWFDPESETYKSVTTEEFRFTVAKGDENEEVGQVYIPGIMGESVENLGTDILDIRRHSSGFRPIAITPLNNPLYWLAYIMLLLIFIAGIVFLRLYLKQKADVRLTRNRRANKIARKRLKVAESARKASQQERFYEEIEKAVWGYLSDKLSIQQSALSREKVSELLGKYIKDETLVRRLFEVIDSSEFSRYAPSSEKVPMDILYEEAVDLINELEQKIKMK
jgi:hypothetical protein